MAFLDETGLAELWSLVTGRYDAVIDHCWRRYDFVPAGYTLGPVKNVQVAGGGSDKQLSYSDTVSVASNGTVSLSGTIKTIYVATAGGGHNISNMNSLAKKFFLLNNKVYYMPNADAYSDGWLYAKASEAIGYAEGPGDTYTIVHSSDKNAYPHEGGSGNYYYKYSGIPLDNAVSPTQITTGRYTGTGTYGSGSPVNLTFNFVPKIVFVWGSASGSQGIFVPAGLTGNFALYGYASVTNDTLSTSGRYAKISGKTLSWYQNSNALQQMNSSNTVYTYVAVG